MRPNPNKAHFISVIFIYRRSIFENRSWLILEMGGYLWVLQIVLSVNNDFIIIIIWKYFNLFFTSLFSFSERFTGLFTIPLLRNIVWKTVVKKENKQQYSFIFILKWKLSLRIHYLENLLQKHQQYYYKIFYKKYSLMTCY